MTQDQGPRTKDHPIIVLATRNRHKIEELRHMLAGSPFDVLSLDDVPPMEEVEENARTLEGNALRKAFAVARATGKPALADDSGLFVDALDGGPGVRSSRFMGEETSYAVKNAEIIRRVTADPLKRRSARFQCVMALVDWERRWCEVFWGIVEGAIAPVACGQGGFGYDPIFLPVGYNCTFAEMTGDEKHRLSHRGRALAQVAAFLERC